MENNVVRPPVRGVWFQLIHNTRLVGTAFLLSLFFWTFGYDGGIVNGLLAVPEFVEQYASGKTPNGIPMWSPADISMITAVPTVGSLLGVPFAAFAADRWGRKVTVQLACCVSILGAVLQVAASGIALYTVGRAIGFISIFIFISLGTAWLAEISPPEVRGIFVGLSIIVIDLAAVVTSCINQGTKDLQTTAAYRIPLGLQIAWPVIISLGCFFISDSPTFYLIKGQDNKAEASLRSVRNGYSETEILAELDALRAQKTLRQQEDEVHWTELFKGTNLRRTLLAMSIGNFQQLSGIAFATNYATIFLEQVAGGADPFVLVIGLTILALGGACVGLVLVDRIGRRTLALSTFSVILVIDIVIGALGFADATQSVAVPKAIAAFSLMFGFFFAAGFGPLTYIVASEMPTARLRNKTSSFTFFVLICFSITVVYVLPYISQPNGANLGAKTYLIFAGWMLMVTIVTFFCLPETKGRSPAELDEMFSAKVPARKFKTYVCSTATEQFIPEAEKRAHGSMDHVEKSGFEYSVIGNSEE